MTSDELDRTPLPQPSPLAGPPHDVHFEQPGPDDHRLALAMLLTGRPNPQDRAVESFLSFAADHELDLEHLYLARSGGRPTVAALLVPGAGRTGMLFLSPIVSLEQLAQQAALVRHTLQQPPAVALSLVQCLLDPSERLHRQTLESAGFTALATLEYMQSRRLGPSRELHLPDPVMQVVAWDEAHRELFGKAIIASYEGTRDCPGLVGLRSVEDILAGHIAAGLFQPQWWRAVHREGEPVAVVLVNQVHGRGFGELVYLGIAPHWRGKGLAHRLLQYAMGMLAEAGLEGMLLAVDQDNAPAIRLYRSLGFYATGRKLAMIRAPQTQP